MNKYQRFALNHYLCDWPEKWSFKRVIDQLKSGDETDEITRANEYESIWPEEMAVVIKGMVSSLKKAFP